MDGGSVAAEHFVLQIADSGVIATLLVHKIYDYLNYFL